MKAQIALRSVISIVLQWLGAVVAFIVGSMASNALLPLPKTVLDAVPAAGFLSGPAALLFSAAVIATILLWAARRSSFKGVTLWLQLLVLCFGAQTFQT